MLRRIFVVASCAVTLALSAWPASAAVSRTHVFSIPGVYGVRAWGTYREIGIRVRISVCVEDTAPGVYGAAAVGLAFDSSYRQHENVGAATIGYHHIQCRARVRLPERRIISGCFGHAARLRSSMVAGS